LLGLFRNVSHSDAPVHVIDCRAQADGLIVRALDSLQLLESLAAQAGALLLIQACSATERRFHFTSTRYSAFHIRYSPHGALHLTCYNAFSFKK
jgi:hypothetical protein